MKIMKIMESNIKSLEMVICETKIKICFSLMVK